MRPLFGYFRGNCCQQHSFPTKPSSCRAIARTSPKALQPLLFLVTLHPAPLLPSLPAQAMLHSPLHSMTTHQSRDTLLDQGQAQHCHSLALLLTTSTARGQQLETASLLAQEKRECFSSDDSIASARCSATARTSLPLKEPLLSLKGQQEHEIRGRRLITAM